MLHKFLIEKKYYIKVQTIITSQPMLKCNNTLRSNKSWNATESKPCCVELTLEYTSNNVDTKTE